VVFGENGLSRKGASATASSYYLTFPRLTVSGRLTLEGREQAVHGQAWMDHEISSSQLDDDQAGWDWASLQLDDGREIMAYRMRKRDGSTDPSPPWPGWIRRARSPISTTNNSAGSTLRTWKSPATGGVYPVPVKIAPRIPRAGNRSFTLEPLLLEQELTGAGWRGLLGRRLPRAG
jgi:predicted secreted hydrolase